MFVTLHTKNDINKIAKTLIPITLEFFIFCFFDDLLFVSDGLGDIGTGALFGFSIIVSSVLCKGLVSSLIPYFRN